MFSVSDIKEDVYPAVYRRGKELYETGGVLDFAYDIYLEHDLPVAEVRAEVRGREQGSYRVTVVVDEEYGSVMRWESREAPRRRSLPPRCRRRERLRRF